MGNILKIPNPVNPDSDNALRQKLWKDPNSELRQLQDRQQKARNIGHSPPPRLLALSALKTGGSALEGGHHLLGEDAELVLEDLQRHTHDGADVDALDAGVALFGLLEALHH